MGSKRRIDVKNIDLEISDITVGHDFIRFNWDSRIGFGEYTIYEGINKEWYAHSECMDSQEDKAFLKELMDKFIDKIQIKG